MTTARLSPEADRARRTRNYLVAMAVRTLSFPVAVWGFMSGHHVLGALAALLATFIPSIAVMLANAVDHRQVEAPRPSSPVQGLAAGRGDVGATAAGAAPQEPVVITGSLVE